MIRKYIHTNSSNKITNIVINQQKTTYEMEKELEKIIALESPTNSLEAMRLNSTIKAPNYQRESINKTIGRLKDISSKKFSCNRTNDIYFTIKRTR